MQSHCDSIGMCLWLCVCVCAVGVGGSGPGGFREVSGETFEVCTGLGEKLQGPESQRKRVRTSAQVQMIHTVINTN